MHSDNKSEPISIQYIVAKHQRFQNLTHFHLNRFHIILGRIQLNIQVHHAEVLYQDMDTQTKHSTRRYNIAHINRRHVQNHTFFEHRKVPKDLATLLLYYDDGGITDCKEDPPSKRKLQTRHPKVQKGPQIQKRKLHPVLLHRAQILASKRDHLLHRDRQDQPPTVSLAYARTSARVASIRASRRSCRNHRCCNLP